MAVINANAATAVNSNSVLTDTPVDAGGLLEVNNSTLAPLVHISAAFCLCLDELREDKIGVCIVEGNEFDLSGEAQRGTMGTAAGWLGWLLLGALAVVTAVHAITLVQAHTHLSAEGGDVFAIVRIGGVVLVELFAVVTAVLLATHRLRARQKPAAMAVEATWFVFAAINLISSFAVEAGGPMPQFVTTWITYGLPVSALVMGALFYLTLRLDPDAARADEEAETAEMFARVRHQARQEVLASPQMRATIRQAEWMTLPAVVGRQMNLSQRQIDHLVRQAPDLLDLNQNGVADIHEQQPAYSVNGSRPTPQPDGHR